MIFASDNAVGAPQEILDAIAAANHGGQGSYGGDVFAQKAEAMLSDLFERKVRALFVVTGTAANALALAAYREPWESALCHREAHVEEDECGAPDFYSGGKLLLIDGPHGRIDPAALAGAIQSAGALGVHQSQPRILTITNATEAGTVYSPAQVAELADIARARGLAVHMDGARFANAIAATGATPAQMTWRAGVDALTFGGAKAGALAMEAVVFFEPDRDAAQIRRFEFLRKRGGHLVSKGRLLSAQMTALLEGDLWLRLARRANAASARMAAAIDATPGASLVHPVEANMIFARLPLAACARLRAAGATFYPAPGWQSDDGDGQTLGVRLVCSWATTEAETGAFAAALAG